MDACFNEFALKKGLSLLDDNLEPEEMSLSENQKLHVCIEYCTAPRPSLSLRGDSAAYVERFNMVEEAIDGEFNSEGCQMQVHSNCRPTASGETYPIEPRVGAFEATYVLMEKLEGSDQWTQFGGNKQMVLSSKLQTKKWPKPSNVATKLRQAVQTDLTRKHHEQQMMSFVAGSQLKDITTTNNSELNRLRDDIEEWGGKDAPNDANCGVGGAEDMANAAAMSLMAVDEDPFDMADNIAAMSLMARDETAFQPELVLQ